MKTTIKNLIALAIVFGLTTSAVMAKTTDEVKYSTQLTNVKRINKINISGNVEVTLVQSADENVKVYNNYYANYALVQQQGNELRITNYDKKTLNVVVFVSNLSEINASGNAVVKTDAKFNALGLDVILKDNAKAVLNTTSVSFFAKVTDCAKLVLTGKTDEYVAVIGSLANVQTDQFATINSSVQAQDIAVVTVQKQVSLPEVEELYNL